VSDVYDRTRLVELFGEDPATLAEVEREFLVTAREAEREIDATDDLAMIARAAHRLKGTAAMIGAADLAHVAGAVERAAHGGDLPGVRRLGDAFSQEIERIAKTMR
jgi:HPt (histidine-containing phosphotransfer) domain-containing protein